MDPILEKIRAASGITPDRIEDIHVWLENAFIAYRLVGYSDSDEIRFAEGRAIAHLAAFGSGNGTSYGSSTWTLLRPGQSSGQFAFMTNGAITYRGTTVYTWAAKTSTVGQQSSVRFAPPEPLTNKVALLLWDDDSGGVGGWLLDSGSGRILSRQVVPDRWRVLPWVSWSPDGRYALFTASGEVTMGDMLLVDSSTGTTREIHYPDFTRDHGNLELQIAEFANLRWPSADRYRIAVTVRCNVYETGACDPNRLLSTHTVE